EPAAHQMPTMFHPPPQLVTIPPMRTLLALPLLLLLVGCSTTRTFDIEVKNETGTPLTVGLVKEGDPFEPEWASPEDAAIAQQQPIAYMWAAIDTGKTATMGPVKGEFNSKAKAY